jgi:hypothetical protein
VMPCVPLLDRGRRVGILCMGNEPVEITHQGKRYLFEWTGASGWVAVNQDGTERLSPVPSAVYRQLPEKGGE